MNQETQPNQARPVCSQEALLVLTEDGEFRQSWVLAQALTTIGRQDDNVVCVPDRWVSRHHACIRCDGTHYILEDLGSKNGLFVNGSRVVEPVVLEDGDRIQIAPCYELAFVDNEATAPVFRQQAGIVVDEVTRRVWVMGIELDPPLSSRQFALLQSLVNAPERVFSRDDLIPIAWPGEDPAGISDEAVNSLIRRLRERLTDIDPSHRYILAIRGHGFRFEQP
jgi:hypothetical protein